MSINKTLEQRGERYGKFKDVAATTYALQEILRDAKNHEHMTDDQVMSCFSGIYAMVFALALIFSPREV